MSRRMEDRIEKLSREFVAEQNPDKARELSAQLRTELHQFVKTLRARITHYPVVEERRVQRGVPLPALTVSEKASPIGAIEPTLKVTGHPKPPAI